MVVVFLFLLLVAVALGIVGAVVHGLLYLLFIGVVILLVGFAFGGVRFRRGGTRPPR